MLKSSVAFASSSYENSTDLSTVMPVISGDVPSRVLPESGDLTALPPISNQENTEN